MLGQPAGKNLSQVGLCADSEHRVHKSNNRAASEPWHEAGFAWPGGLRYQVPMISASRQKRLPPAPPASCAAACPGGSGEALGFRVKSSYL